MERYIDLNFDSGVYGYEIGPYFIEVWFVNGKRSYRYSYHKAGEENVENMKILARQGDGLNAYINNHVKYLYD